MITLESSKLFSFVPALELQKLHQAVRELCFGDGEQIFKEGDPGDGIYVVKEGQAQISVLVGTGERTVFSTAGPGEVFGEMAVLDNQPRSACATAKGQAVIYFVPREKILELLKSCPEVALNFLQEVSRRLREFNRHYLRGVVQAERFALIGRFARSIVHDLKTPLNVISLSAEFACSEKTSPERRRAAQEQIARQVERITEMVNDILDFTRGSSQAVKFKEVDYAAFLKPLLEELKSESKLKGVAIELENQPPAAALPINPQRLRRVFHNLVANAIDAMPAGGKIKLRFQTSATAVVTEIEDSGHGIAPEIADRLFEAFATYGKERGTGLGLSICQKIVEEHGGKISARNQPGSGAVFAFSLPRQFPLSPSDGERAG